MLDPSPLLRQWNLLAALAEHQAGLGVEELARERDVGEKTIRRDLILLRRAGFPLVETRASHGRKLWRLAAAAPALDLDWQEAMSLYLARQFLEPLSGTYFWQAANRAFAKIRAGLGKEPLKYLDRMAKTVHLTAPGVGRYADKAAFLDQLTLAIEESRITLLTYQSERSTEPVTREVYPYAWVFHRNSPYLVAFATEHQEVRLYKADRIHKKVDATPLRFTRPADFNAVDIPGRFVRHLPRRPRRSNHDSRALSSGGRAICDREKLAPQPEIDPPPPTARSSVNSH